MSFPFHSAHLLLSVFLLCFLTSTISQSIQWCPTSVTPLPNLTLLLPPSSPSYVWNSFADDECSDFFFSALPSHNSTASPLIARSSPSLNVSFINPSPIPSSLFSLGLHSIAGMVYFNLYLYVSISLSPSSSSPHRHIRASPRSAILVLSRSTLEVLHSYPLSSPLLWLAVDYSTDPPTLYSAPSTSPSSLLTFAISSTGQLTPTAPIPLPHLPSIVSATLFNPGTLLFLQSLTVNSSFSARFLSWDVGSKTVSEMLNVTGMASPALSLASFWSTELPGFGSLHFINSRALYNFDLC